MNTLAELVIIRNLVDSILADRPNGAVELALYMSRVHLMEAIRHQASCDSAHARQAVSA
jgi:hypothetical protein